MGYHSYKHLIYGVAVTEKQAKKLYKEFCDEDKGTFSISDSCPYIIELRSDGTDGRAEDIYYEPGCDHYFGLILSDDNKETAKMIKNPPKFIYQVFEQYIQPVLEKHKIKTKPDFHTFVQTL